MTLLAYVLAIALVVWIALYLVGLVPAPSPLSGPVAAIRLVLQVAICIVAIVLLFEVLGGWRVPMLR